MINTKYVEQKFRWVTIECYRACEGESLTDDDIKIICESLNSAFTSDNKVDYISKIEKDEEGDMVEITIGQIGSLDAFYEKDCLVEPGYAGSLYDPPEPGSIDCYESAWDLLHDFWDCPNDYGWDTVDEDFDTEDMLWERLEELERFDPDDYGDQQYEEWRDRRF